MPIQSKLDITELLFQINEQKEPSSKFTKLTNGNHLYNTAFKPIITLLPVS